MQKEELKEAVCLKENYRLVSGHVRDIKFFSYPAGMCHMNEGKKTQTTNQNTEGQKCVTINYNSLSTNLSFHIKN